MATQIEELAVRFSAQTEELTRELNRLSATAARAGKKTAKKLGVIQRSLDKIGTAAKKAGALLAAAFAARELIRLGFHFKNAARDAEEMESKFDAVFRTSSADVRDWAETLASEVNRSRFALMEFASTFQDTFVPLGFARAEAAELSKQLVALSVDVASFNNKLESDVIRDFQSALVGNHETVRKYGIIVTETTLTQEILNSGLAETKSEITELNKVQGRMNIIMKGTSDAQGDAARTAGSQANKEKELAAAFEELSITLGQLLAPSALAATEGLTDVTNALLDLFAAAKPGSTLNSEIIRFSDLLHDLGDKADILREGGFEAFLLASPLSGGVEGELNRTILQLQQVQNELTKLIKLQGERDSSTNDQAARAKFIERSKERIALIKREEEAEVKARSDAAKKAAEELEKIRPKVQAELEGLRNDVFKINNDVFAIINETAKLELEAFRKVFEGKVNFEEEFLEAKKLIEQKRVAETVKAQREIDEEEISSSFKRFKAIVAKRKAAAEEERKILEDNMREAQRHADDFANSFSSAFDELIFAGGKLSDVLKGLLKDLVRMALHKAILGPIAASLGGSVAGLFGFAKGGVMTGGGPAPLRSYAGGGIASSPQVALFGEGTRPEAFVPLPDGRNIPVKLEGGGGGRGNTVIEQNILFTTDVKNSVRAEVINMAPAIIEAAKAAVSSANRGRR